MKAPAAARKARMRVDNPFAANGWCAFQRAGQAFDRLLLRHGMGERAQHQSAFGRAPVKQCVADHHRRDFGIGPFDPPVDVAGEGKTGNRVLGQSGLLTQRQARRKVACGRLCAAVAPELRDPLDQRCDFALFVRSAGCGRRGA